MSAATQVFNRGAFLSHEKDYNHATDKQYQSLRKQADQAYQKRNQLSHDSQQAFKSGDKLKAHELSVASKKQLEIAEGYNRQAAEYVFVENNADSDSNEIDLHGLYVKELEYILKQRIVAGINRHESKLEVIVGKGLHSANGVAKLKPAIEELCQESNLKNYIDPHNTGVLVIELTNAQIPSSWPQNPGNYQRPSKPPGSYQQQPQGQQQPHYQQGQQQQSYNNYNQQQQHYNNNNNNNNNNNGIAGLVIKLLCACLNSK